MPTARATLSPAGESPRTLGGRYCGHARLGEPRPSSGPQSHAELYQRLSLKLRVHIWKAALRLPARHMSPAPARGPPYSSMGALARATRRRDQPGALRESDSESGGESGGAPGGEGAQWAP